MIFLKFQIPFIEIFLEEVIFLFIFTDFKTTKKTKQLINYYMNSINIFRKLFVLCAFLFSTNLMFSQNIVSGSVSDAEGNPLPGVSIVEKGTSNGTVSDFDGNFQLNAGDSATLIFSYIGYLTQELGISRT